MILRAIPLFLIIFPLISFFVSEQTFFSNSNNISWIRSLAYILYTLPWYFKIVSIMIGSWLISIQKK